MPKARFSHAKTSFFGACFPIGQCKSGSTAPRQRFSALFALRAARGSRLAIGPTCFYLFVGSLHLIQFQVAQPLDIDHLIASLVHGTNQLIELQIDRSRVAILVFWIKKTIRNVAIAVPVLITIAQWF